MSRNLVINVGDKKATITWHTQAHLIIVCGVISVSFHADDIRIVPEERMLKIDQTWFHDVQPDQCSLVSEFLKGH